MNKVPENYVRSKCCKAYQDPRNEKCVRCGELFQAEEAVKKLTVENFLAALKSIGITKADEDLVKMGAGNWFYTTDAGEVLVSTLEEALQWTIELCAAPYKDYVEMVANQGYWSTKMPRERALAILDEHTDMARALIRKDK